MNGLTGEDGQKALVQWINTVMTTPLDPLKKFARMVKRHLQKLMNYFIHLELFSTKLRLKT
jgi:transposase